MAKQVLRAEIIRTEDGILLYLESSHEFENLMKTLAGGKSFKGVVGPLTGIRIYKIPTDFKCNGLRLAGMDTKLVQSTSYRSGVIVLSYLRAVGISKGVVIHIKGLFTDKEIKEYLRRLRKRVADLYNILKGRKLEVHR